MTRAAGIVFVIFAALQTLAQGASTIVGRVTSSGKPLASASVTIDADVLQNTRVTRTTNRGTYWAALLPPGTYRITFAHSGTQTVTRKAEVRLGETVRVDADLQPSDEGESVTMTTITRSILERPQLSSSFDSGVVDDLPLARDLTTRMILAPGVIGGTVRGSSENVYIVDGVVQQHRGANVEIEEGLADAAVIETTTSAEFGRFAGGVILATSGSGGNQLTASFRDTATSGSWTAAENDGSGIDNRAEAAVGGPLVRDALWFFLAGENGTRTPDGRERSGFGKLTASPGSHVTLVGSVLRAPIPDESRASGDATVVITSRAVISARADTSRVGNEREQHQFLSIHSLVPTPFGDHAFVLGGERFHDATSVFAGDNWSDGRWVVSGSGRFDSGHGFSPRAGVAYDVSGDGHARIAASYGRYTGDLDTSRETALTWSQRVFTSGYARVSAVRRIYDSGTTYRALEGDIRAEYLVFTFGAAASVAEHRSSGVAWISGMPPGLEQHVAIALLERYRGGAATDISVQYHFIRYRFEPFVKLDVMNIFDRQLAVSDDPLGARRALRISFGGRL